MSSTEESTGKFVKAGNVRIHYHETGTGYPLICTHGAGPGASAWSNFKGNVGELSGHYRTILMDMPQYGKSDKPNIEGGRLAFLAKVVRDFMEALEIKRAHFVGNSMMRTGYIEAGHRLPGEGCAGGRHRQQPH